MRRWLSKGSRSIPVVVTHTLCVVVLLWAFPAWASDDCTALLEAMEHDGFRQVFSASGNEWRKVEFRPSPTSNVKATGKYVEIDVRESTTGELGTRHNTMSCEDNRILMHHSIDPANETREAYDPPIPWVPVTALDKPGHQWTWEGDVTMAGDGQVSTFSATATGEVVGNETVDTPVGKTDATLIRLVVTLDVSGEPIALTIDSWVDTQQHYRVIKRHTVGPGMETNMMLEEEHLDSRKATKETE